MVYLAGCAIATLLNFGSIWCDHNLGKRYCKKKTLQCEFTYIGWAIYLIFWTVIYWNLKSPH